MEKNKKKEWMMVALKCVIFALCAGGMSTGLHMFNSIYIAHEHGKPAFVTNSLLIYSACEKIVFVIGYVTLGKKLQIKNGVLRGFTYMVLIWTSNMLPQFMGMAFADGEIAKQAFVMSDLIIDGTVYLLSGVVLGLLFRNIGDAAYVPCEKKKVRKAMLVSAIAFPVSIMVVDQIVAKVNVAFSSLGALQVSDEVKTAFYINFYAWFILSGALIALFYRMTEYGKGKNAWLSFGLKYGVFIWTPVVLIMIVFGTSALETIVFNFLFIACILAVTWLTDKVLNQKSA